MEIVLLTARDPLQAGDPGHPLHVAADLRAQGHDVTLVLLEDAVVVARAGHRLAADLDAAVAAGVRVLVEDEALARRVVGRLADGVKPADLGEVVDLVMVHSDRQAWL